MKVIEVNIEIDENLSTQQENRFWDNFISQTIEANNLQIDSYSLYAELLWNRNNLSRDYIEICITFLKHLLLE